MEQDRRSALLTLLPRGDSLEARARVMQRLQERRPPRRWPIPVAVTGAVALAALAFFALRPPALVDAALDASEWQTLRVSDHVIMDLKGSGALSGTELDQVVAWESGVIRVEIEPGEGVHLQVDTPEGSAKALGTVFTVERDSLGTRVQVERGRVEVTCQGAQAIVVGPGEDADCQARHPGALLARARAQGGEQALSTIDEAFELGPTPVMEGELRALRVEKLVTLGRKPEALAEARAYLEVGGPRATQLNKLGADLALGLEGCEGAVPFLDKLGDAASAVELVHLADCLASDPERARAALERALELAPDQADPIRVRLERL